ncbi:MAG: aminotransferase class V-fold PLP-dependent enzyme [Bacteroidota bacterium]
MSTKIYFTPGPAQLFYTFNDHLKQALVEDVPSISHRSSQFIHITTHATEQLRELLQVPEDFDIFFLSSANEAWDRLIQNLVVEKSHHFVNGYFSQKFYDFALKYGMKSTVTEVPYGESFSDLGVPAGSELIGITKNETSVGYAFTDEEIATIRKENPDAILALDVVSATPSVPIDFQNIDSAYFSVQKAFGLPPGLGVWICNQRCQEKAIEKSKITSIGSYRSLPNLKKFADKNQTPETPNSLFIYLIGKIAEDMVRMGRQRIVNDTVYKATILYQAIANNPHLEAFVESKDNQSKSTIVAKTEKKEMFLSTFLAKGMVLGSGYGMYKDQHIRIANFPTHSKEIVEMMVDIIGETE